MLTIGSATHMGIKRADHPNQDSLGTCQPGWLQRRPPLLVVADGMGGYNGGEIASRIVVQTLVNAYKKPFLPANPQDFLRAAMLQAQRAVQARAAGDEHLGKMGSTVVAVIVEEKRLHVGNVGDSRAYLADAHTFTCISYDHSIVGDLLRAGQITPQEARVHPRRNMLSQSISGQRPAVEPFTNTLEFRPGTDRVLLCSDGLWGVVPEEHIHAVLMGLPPQAAAERLVDLANENEGPDNISVIVAA